MKESIDTVAKIILNETKHEFPDYSKKNYTGIRCIWYRYCFEIGRQNNRVFVKEVAGTLIELSIV